MNKTVLHCIGDSHASFFSGGDRMISEFPGKTENSLACFRAYRVGAATAYNLVTENSSSKGREKVCNILDTLEKGSDILLVFGEIDCRVHLLKQAKKSSREAVVQKCVDRYIEFARIVKEKGYNVYVWGVIGSTPHIGSFGEDHEYPAVGTMEERNKITRLFNAQLQIEAKKNDIGFVSIFDTLVDTQNVTNVKYYVDEIHLSQRVMPQTITAIKNQLGIHLGVTPTYLFRFVSFIKSKKWFIPIQHITMKKIITKVLSLIPGALDAKEIFDWKYRLNEKGAAPHPLKQKVIKQYQKKYNATIFVETGTYMGKMVDAMKNIFSKMYSIELGDELHANAVKKFAEYKHIEIVHGDSGEMMPKVLENIDDVALFWLDGHYSGGITATAELETPIKKELEAIFSHKIKNHVILIDDARMFVGSNDYPTMEELSTFVKEVRSDAHIENKEDIIRITFA